MNLSAPFIPQFFKVQLESILPYCDIVIGNEAEAEAWAAASGQPDPKDMSAVAVALASVPKSNASRARTVIITQGPHSTIVATFGDEAPKVHPVTPLASEAIVDTNGAGDAFAGGFLGAHVIGKELDVCIEVGHKLGRMCVQQVS